MHNSLRNRLAWSRRTYTEVSNTETCTYVLSSRLNREMSANDQIPSRAVSSGRAQQLWNKRDMHASSETVLCSLIVRAQMFL